MEGTASITSRQHEKELIGRAEEAIAAARDELRSGISDGRLNMPRPVEVELEDGTWTFGHFGGFFNATNSYKLFRFGDARPEVSANGTITHEELTKETQAAIAEALARGDRVTLDTAKELDDLPRREDGREYVCLVLHGTDGTEGRVPYRIGHVAYRMKDGRSLTLGILAMALAERDARDAGDDELADAIAGISSAHRQRSLPVFYQVWPNDPITNDLPKYETHSIYTPQNPKVLHCESAEDKRRKIVVETKYSLSIADEAVKPLLGEPYLLTQNDIANLSAYMTIWVALREEIERGEIERDEAAFTPEQLWAVRTGGKPAAAHDAAVQAIIGSIEKMRRIIVCMDYTQALRGRKTFPQGTPFEGQPIASGSRDDFLVVARGCTLVSLNGQYVRGYEPYMERPPILLEHAYAVNQYLTIDQDLIRAVCSITGTRDRATLCRDYLIKRIRRMKNSGNNSVRSRKIAYDTIIKNMGGPTKSKRQRTSDLALIDKTLKILAEQGEIRGSSEYPKPEERGSAHRALGVLIQL